MSDAFEKMDSMYRYQRYFYDATRKYYLFGRDRLINEMKIKPSEKILEVGCGTARNLIILAKKYPQTNFFGLDASNAMLETARAKIDSKKLYNIHLENALADNFSFWETFNLQSPFHQIFFSYSISMIPTWKKALAVALENLSPNGSIFIVDFYDQKNLPQWFQSTLKIWLRQFHVQFWDELIPHLQELEKQELGNLEITPIFRRYAFIAKFQKKT